MPARSPTRGFVERPPAPPEGGYGGGGGGGDWGASRRAAFTGLMVLLAATGMIFAALTSAYVVTRGASGIWNITPLPRVLWANTTALMASSALLEAARHGLKTGHRTAFNRLWTAGTLCGIAFLLGQGYAWRELREAGFFLAGNPSSAFFYLLTGSHAIHALGGIGALVYVDVQALRWELGPARRTLAGLSALFWHFLDGVWICLLALFSFWG